VTFVLRFRGLSSVLGTLLLLVGLTCPSARPLSGQVTQATDLIVVRGRSVLIQDTGIERAAVADAEIAEAVAVSTRELIVNGLGYGRTTLTLWAGGAVRFYEVIVVPDATTLQNTLRAAFPNEAVTVTPVGGNGVVLSGSVRSPEMAERIRALATTPGLTIIDRMQVAALPQVMLQVQVAEVSRSALKDIGVELLSTNPQRLDASGDWTVESSSDVVRLLLMSDDSNLQIAINALQTKGLFRSLAEPTLMTVSGKEATFLAGGEFPFPMVTGNALSERVSIVFREFGISLKFTPTVLEDGLINLKVAPEVSSLDFSGGSTLNGVRIPALLARRAVTEVQLLPGQHLAIAGLLDNSQSDDVSYVPILGKIPLIGRLFSHTVKRESDRELLVVVTPTLVQPTNNPVPLPTVPQP
jgi:pilus assembly protein CpaC